MNRKISFYWGDGYVVCSLAAGNLVFKALNTKMVFENRSLYIEGLFERVREYRWRRGKNVYVDLAFPIRGVSGEGVIYMADADAHIGSYGLVYTAVEGVGYYLTIYPSPGSLYEYSVVSKDRVMLRTGLRREVYLVKEGDGRRLILV